MATSKEDIERWLREGKRVKATHVIIVVDRFDHEDYPVFVEVGQDIKQIVADYKAGKHEMQDIMEVYSMNRDLETQLNEYRAFHLD